MKRCDIPYRPYLKEYARKLRNNMTLSEVLLWGKLKRKQLLGFDFDRQRPLLNYIVDFYCPELKLAIEIDGNSHRCKFEDDAKRQSELESYGITFIRIDDLKVKKEMVEVLRIIQIIVEDKLNDRGIQGQILPTPTPPEGI